MLRIIDYNVPGDSDLRLAVAALRAPGGGESLSDSGTCAGSKAPAWPIRACQYCGHYHPDAPEGPECFKGEAPGPFALGDADLAFAADMVKKGPAYRAFLKALTVTISMEAPIYFWKALEGFGAIAGLRAEVSRILDRPISNFDFTQPETIPGEPLFKNDENPGGVTALKAAVDALNYYRADWLETGDEADFNAMRALLPQGFTLRGVAAFNYEDLTRVMAFDEGAAMPEWTMLTGWIEKNVPYAKEFIEGGWE